MIDRICAQLSEQANDLRIQRIVKTEEMYLVWLSDKYGNDMDMLPLGFDIESGKEVYVDYDFDSSGVNCTIPEAYRTYRNIVCSQLDANTPDSIVNELGPYGIDYAINAVFSEYAYVSDISISQLYAVCNYMIHSIVFSCTAEEKSSFRLLMKNDMITSFIEMNTFEKLKYVDSYYYTPDYVEKVNDLSNELLLLAKDKKAGKTISREDSDALIENIRKAVNEAYAKLDGEPNPICDIHILKNRLNTISSYSEIESNYCSGLSDAITERMKEKDEAIGFSSRPIFTGNDVKFGTSGE